MGPHQSNEEDRRETSIPAPPSLSAPSVQLGRILGMCGAGIHYDNLPPGGYVQDGQRGRRGRGGGRPPAGARRPEAARRRRLRHAHNRPGQHQRADHHDRGEGVGYDFGGRALVCVLTCLQTPLSSSAKADDPVSASLSFTDAGGYWMPRLRA